MTTLGRRLTAMAALVSLASVLITGVAMIGLFRQGATHAAQLALGRDADTVAGTVQSISRLAARRQRVRTTAVNRQLARRQVTWVIVGPQDAAPGALPPPFQPQDVSRTLATGTVSAIHSANGKDWLVEGRTAGSVAVLLGQPVNEATAQSATPISRLLLALLLGLLGGALAGWLMARQLARPLSRLALTARQLSAGDRDVHVPAEGPAEMADVGEAMNGLAYALASSEARQRRFLMDVSHELRTPLTAVAGYAEGLADGVLTGDQVVPAAQVIRAEAARLGRRVDDLLALARMEADDFQLQLAPTDLAELVRDAGRAWQPRAQAGRVTLHVDAPPTPIVVNTDAERLRQAIDALADNALRVLSAGHWLSFGCGTDGELAWVQVSDDGPGLAEEDLAVAFERGQLAERYRGDRAVGSGLGLALVGELARRLGGKAVAQHMPESGVSFSLILPIR